MPLIHMFLVIKTDIEKPKILEKQIAINDLSVYINQGTSK